MNITHQMQPTNDTCTSACIAMITDTPVNDVIKEFHQDYCASKITPYLYLTRKLGIGCRRCFTDEIIQNFEEGVLLLSVPSLNMQGVLHSILLDCDNNDVIYDPNMGKQGKKYYTSIPKPDLLARTLQGYCIELHII